MALNSPAGVLAVFAHPDDAELICYGTLRKFATQNSVVKVLIMTNGSNGFSVSGQANPQLPALRRDETIAALQQVTSSIRFCDFPDGNLISNADLIGAIETAINDEQPELVVSHFADRTGVDHQDHSAVARSVRNVCFRKPFVRCLLSGEPIQPYTDFQPNVFVDITPHFDEKCGALVRHRSQAGRHYLERAFHEARSTRWASLANPEPSAGARYFESFRLEKLVVPA
jgi:LmbE family N-acetylglucosaminyl deacetylase